MLHSSQQDPSLVSQQDVIKMQQRVKMIHNKLQMKLQQTSTELSELQKLQQQVGQSTANMDAIVKKRLEKMKFNVGMQSMPQVPLQMPQVPVQLPQHYQQSYIPPQSTQMPQIHAASAPPPLTQSILPTAPQMSPVEPKHDSSPSKSNQPQVSLIDL